MHGTIELPAMRRAADLLPATLNEGDRSIEVVWSTGSRVRRQPLFGEPFDEELSMDPSSVRLERLNAGSPLLKVHDLRTLDSVIGSLASVRGGTSLSLSAMQMFRLPNQDRHSASRDYSSTQDSWAKNSAPFSRWNEISPGVALNIHVSWTTPSSS